MHVRARLRDVVMGVALIASSSACKQDDGPPRWTGNGYEAVVQGGKGSSSGGSSGVGGSGGAGAGMAITDPEGPCDTGIDVDAADPLDGARAAGLCKQASGGDWGVISASWVRVDGSDTINQPGFSLGYGIFERFGSLVVPHEGERMLVLSSGVARPVEHPAWQSPAGAFKGYIGTSPAGYPKESPACGGVITGQPHDDVALEVVMRAPQAANGLAFDFNFFTYEWPVYVCSEYNDFFVALLDPAPAGQPDGNISFDQSGNSVSVNNALVRVCDCANGPPCGAPPNAPVIDYGCTLGSSQLGGTGFEDHAASGWLVTTTPITGGEVVRLRWGIYDSADGLLDSTTVIDNFRWLTDGGGGPVTSPG